MFNCSICNYNTSIKCNYSKHLKTKKHKNNILTTQTHTNTTNITNTTNTPHTANIVCEYCNKVFSRTDSLNRHIKSFCKNSPNNATLIEIKKIKELHQSQIEKLDLERNVLLNHIEKLLEHVGDTTNITNNQQIVLNCYGKEDLSHITETIKAELIKVPFVMIPKMIKAVHFNENCPQNKNICLPNKKQPYVKIFQGKSWIYKDKREIIQELIDKNYIRLDDYYETTGKNNLKEDEQNRYLNFQNEKEQDSDSFNKISKDVEMILLNSHDKT